MKGSSSTQQQLGTKGSKDNGGLVSKLKKLPVANYVKAIKQDRVAREKVEKYAGKAAAKFPKFNSFYEKAKTYFTYFTRLMFAIKAAKFTGAFAVGWFALLFVTSGCTGLNVCSMMPISILLAIPTFGLFNHVSPASESKKSIDGWDLAQKVIDHST